MDDDGTFLYFRAYDGNVEGDTDPMAQPATQVMSTESEPLPIRHVQTVRVRERGKNERRVTITEAVRAAGLDGGATFQFKPFEYDELGVIPALGSPAGESAPKDRNTRKATTDGHVSIQIALPKQVIEVLEDATGNTDDPIFVDVFAGERMVAIAPTAAIEVPTTALPEDPDRVIDDERESVQLEAVQTARPRVKVSSDGASRMVELTATEAVRRARLTSTTDEPYSVSFHPEAAESLGGLIPAVGYQRGAGIGDPEYSIYREQGGGSDTQPEVYSIGVPTPLIEALGLSVDELENLERSERPQITVYAADGMLGFKTPSVREIAVESDCRGELVDVDGIGEAVAERLRDRGYNSPEDLEGIAREDLLEIESVSTGRADRILADLDERGGT